VNTSEEPERLTKGELAGARETLRGLGEVLTAQAHAGAPDQVLDDLLTAMRHQHERIAGHLTATTGTALAASPRRALRRLANVA
jgi:hypothetical protein